jgi:hypothetical protein
MAYERRTDSRRRVLKGGSIAFQYGSTIDCTIRNLSSTGACIEVETPVGVPDSFTLIVRQHGHSRSARVKWRKGRRIGVEFL